MYKRQVPADGQPLQIVIPPVIDCDLGIFMDGVQVLPIMVTERIIIENAVG